jgi:hypothetical protein
LLTLEFWYNNSITHTQKEQGAWWQVDLGKNAITNKARLKNLPI